VVVRAHPDQQQLVGVRERLGDAAAAEARVERTVRCQLGDPAAGGGAAADQRAAVDEAAHASHLCGTDAELRLDRPRRTAIGCGAQQPHGVAAGRHREEARAVSCERRRQADGAVQREAPRAERLVGASVGRRERHQRRHAVAVAAADRSRHGDRHAGVVVHDRRRRGGRGVEAQGGHAAGAEVRIDAAVIGREQAGAHADAAADGAKVGEPLREHVDPLVAVVRRDG
jgi:hypothetical protein